VKTAIIDLLSIEMGSRLTTSSDGPLHQNMKDAVVKKTEQDTIYSKNFDGIHACVMKTPEAMKAVAIVMQACSNIQSPISLIRPVSSAIGMNSTGDIIPAVG
jgi:hypothetical protein